MEEKDQKQMSWLMIALIAFNFVEGLGNVVNNIAQQELWLLHRGSLFLVIYFIRIH